MLFHDRRTGKLGETRTVNHKGKTYTVTRDSGGDIQVSGPGGDFEAAPQAKGNLFEGKGAKPGKRNKEVNQTVKAIKKGQIDSIKVPKSSK